jgi:hypothetical protein
MEDRILKIVQSIAPCGLVCALCWEREEGCPTCTGAEREQDIPCGGCKQRRCCAEKGLSGCWECDELCQEGMFDPASHGPRLRAFVRCIREDGAVQLARYLVENEAEGLFYHTDKIHFTGDYDKPETEEAILALLRFGSRAGGEK